MYSSSFLTLSSVLKNDCEHVLMADLFCKGKLMRSSRRNELYFN